MHGIQHFYRMDQGAQRQRESRNIGRNVIFDSRNPNSMIVELYSGIGRRENEEARCFAKRHYSASNPWTVDVGHSRDSP